MPNVWQDRVGMLFVPPNFMYSYKPVDSPMHGGAVRIDCLACDYNGTFWMVEVKRVEGTAKSFNLLNKIHGVSPLQRQALDDCANAENSIVLLAVGQQDTNLLYLWGWRHVQWLWSERQNQALYLAKTGREKPELLPLDSAPVILHWTGQSKWPPGKVDLRSLFVIGERTPYDHHLSRKFVLTQPRQIVLSPTSSKLDTSPLTLKRLLSILTRKKMQGSGLLS